MWCVRRSRIVVGADPAGAVWSRFVSTPSGGGGGGVPSKFARIHWPRLTGDVRFGADVTVKMLPCPSKRALVRAYRTYATMIAGVQPELDALTAQFIPSATKAAAKPRW
jgi:hypothetical protein